MRRIPVEPLSRLAPLSRWLARVAVGVVVLAILSVRFGGVPPLNGLAVLAVAVALAVLAAIAALAVYWRIWRYGGPGTGLASRSLALALLVLAWPAYLGVLAVRLPVMNDIATDTADPPSFGRSRAASDARAGRVPSEYDRSLAAEQQDAYPDVRPIVIDQGADEVMGLALRAATNLGWQVIDSANPAGRTGAGRIEAVARSSLFRFADDVTIRIRPGVGDTRIDLRSTSRLGRHDFGANAGRIRAFQREIETLAAAR
jgi:type VI protein secretion system component VasK